MVDRIANEGPEKIPVSEFLAPLEHKLFGSTPFNMSMSKVNSLIDDAISGIGEAGEKARIELLRPSVFDAGGNRDEVDKARKAGGERQMGAFDIFGTEAYEEDFVLRDYRLYVRVGELNAQALVEGFDVEFVSIKDKKPALIDEETKLLSEYMEGGRGTSTIRRLIKAKKLKAEFSDENKEGSGDAKRTVMHFRYNFGPET